MFRTYNIRFDFCRCWLNLSSAASSSVVIPFLLLVFSAAILCVLAIFASSGSRVMSDSYHVRTE